MVLRFTAAFVFLLLFSLIVFRIIVRKEYSRKGKLTHVSFLSEILVFALHVHLICIYLPFRLPAMPENTTLRFLSIVLYVLGAIIVCSAIWGLGFARTMGQDSRNLKTDGIYGYSRNPQLLGYGMILLAVAFSHVSWYSLGWYALYLTIAYLMIWTEEEFLRVTHEKEYRLYCAGVPRWIKFSG